MEGRLPEAIDAYLESIEAYPTAEAYTFLGWTYSWMGQYERAIAEAKKAVEIDPDYGNPYNDIGTYLIELGRLDDAIPWLEKAMQAKRYASPHFPHMNLAEIWVRRGMWDEALASYEAVLLLRPQGTLPPLPAPVVPPFAGPDPFAIPADEFQLMELRVAMSAYFLAWSSYDATALMGRSAPPSTTEAAMLLMSLAYAKRARLEMRLLDLDARFLTEGTVLVRPQVQIGQGVLSIPYLLEWGDGVWKVVGSVSAWPWDNEGEPAPLNLIIGPIGPPSSPRA
ncbi:MAG: tetratricopeptide repeat protein [Chloroflexi bacterium]|nr:tetratricopeptide repeat protein [Chloroflexota bacterium]